MEYIHGFSKRERDRLLYQNEVLGPMIYTHINLSAISVLVEVGCGVGAQMIRILDDYPDITVIGVDISEIQLEEAKQNLQKAGIEDSRYQLIHSSGSDIPILDAQADGVLMVWVLEHVQEPIEIIKEAFRVLKNNGKIFITEVFNDSLSIYPRFQEVISFWNKLCDFQHALGGNGNVGMQLGNYLLDSGYHNITTISYPLFYDTRNLSKRNQQFEYWISLMESAAIQMIEAQYITADEWKVVKEKMLYIQSCKDCVFYYNWIQAQGEK
ncbi:MAG: class I SAM-dependent methyltransferase [Bacteroidota bacterium]|nr:class I SAM-dependent methyltransferase [Bacteroidota bacterium]